MIKLTVRSYLQDKVSDRKDRAKFEEHFVRCRPVALAVRPIDSAIGKAAIGAKTIDPPPASQTCNESSNQPANKL